MWIDLTGNKTKTLIKTQDISKKIRLNELFQVCSANPTNEIAGVCIEGVHYYDFTNVKSINNTVMASLIDLSKCLLEQNEKVQFVNVSEKIKSKIKSFGLENILKCS